MARALHTDAIVKLLRDGGIEATPATNVLLHDDEWRIVIVGARYKDVQQATHFLPCYAAVSKLTPDEWIDGLDQVDNRLRRGDSMGQTLVDEGFGWAQNRLFLGSMAANEVPGWVHSRIPDANNELPWQTEMYDIFARNSTGEIGRYARVLEMRPANLELPHREELGSLHVWRACRRHNAAVSRLFAGTPPLRRDAGISLLARAVSRRDVQQSLKLLRHKAVEWQ